MTFSTHSRRTLLLAALSLLGSAPILAQGAAPAAARGRITGRVIDGGSGDGLSNAQVQVVGTTIGALSGVDGRYTLTVPAGTVSILVRRIGYASKTVTGIVVVANKTTEADVTVRQATVQLTTTTVTASAERGTVNEALDKQRTATGIVAAVTAEQMAKSPDGDAAQAIGRVSGVTVQDGRSVFVRGLGERYTTTSLNGARLPSPEPEKRYVPLDIFPSGLLQSINTYKTFTPDRNGDFSGAEIDIQTREFPARRSFTFSTSAGANSAATGQSLVQAPREGGEWFGLAGSARQLPAQLASASAVGQLATQPQVNSAIGSLRSVYSPTVQNGLPNGSMAFSVGGQDPVFGRRVGYLASLNYSASQEVRQAELEQNPVIRDGAIARNEGWAGSMSNLSTLWGGLLNLSTFVGTGSRISFNNTFTRGSDNIARQSFGETFAYSGAVAERTTLRFVARDIRSNQLRGEHEFGRQGFDWNVTNSGVKRDEPDRVDHVRVRSAANQPFLLQEEDPDAIRKTFGTLDETNWVFGANYRLRLGSESSPWVIKLGAQQRNTDRDALNRQFNLQARVGQIPEATRAGSLETLFGSQFLAPNANAWRIGNIAEDGQYTARERLTGGYGMVELPVGSRIKVIGGARVERADIAVTTLLSNNREIPATLVNTDVLPSLVVNVQATQTQALRFSATQTLARPEYRELSPVQILDVIGSATTVGNPNLRRTLIQNLDAKWEWYPASGEVLSLGAFYKRFDGPIERVDIATGGTGQLITFLNANSANNYGVEAEVRKNLGTLAAALSPVTLFGNATFMRSEIQIGDGQSANTNPNRPMMGQAPYVLNSGVTWASTNGQTSATLQYGVVGKRIVAAGVLPYPDLYEMPRNLVDFSLRLPVNGQVALKIDARNLLDAPFRTTQGDFVRQEWRLGRQVSVGFTWRN
ncbi:MAG: outer membrane beta-barrel protein [Gemmatimonadaceae bacterium]|jgi:outer membrane receptor protein involved in Fe transport|nr:outer membrane beta-barrel protein [Gemmatimonadaceae bacterium]